MCRWLPHLRPFSKERLPGQARISYLAFLQLAEKNCLISLVWACYLANLIGKTYRKRLAGVSNGAIDPLGYFISDAMLFADPHEV